MVVNCAVEASISVCCADCNHRRHKGSVFLDDRLVAAPVEGGLVIVGIYYPDADLSRSGERRVSPVFCGHG